MGDIVFAGFDGGDNSARLFVERVFALCRNVIRSNGHGIRLAIWLDSMVKLYG